MSIKKSRYRATIDGKEYTIVGSKSQIHMKTVSDIVNEQMGTLKELTKGLDTETRAILMAINTVSDQVELKHEIEELQEENKTLKEKQDKLEFE